ncbi:MAG: hypothetical protein JXB15_06585 [Anaerolineales bacterium]|nr:hypothetical protein [Anaerolineales bacterium]
MTEIKHLTMTELEAGLDAIRQSPKNKGALELIVRRQLQLRGVNVRVVQPGLIRLGDQVIKLG